MAKPNSSTGMNGKKIADVLYNIWRRFWIFIIVGSIVILGTILILVFLVPCKVGIRLTCKDVCIFKNSDFGRGRPLPGNGLLFTGIDAVTLQFRANPFENNDYSGKCKTVDDGNGGFYQLPDNAEYTSTTSQQDSSFSSSQYSNVGSLVTDVKNSVSNSLSGSISASYQAVGWGVEGGVEVSGSQSTEVQNSLSISTSNVVQFVEAKSDFIFGSFSLTGDSLVFQKGFLDSVRNLPEEFPKSGDGRIDDSAYQTFITNFGTHIVSGGTLGGKARIQQTFTMNTEDVKTFDLNKQSNCFAAKAEVTLRGLLFASATAKASYERCESDETVVGSSRSKSNVQSTSKDFTTPAPSIPLQLGGNVTDTKGNSTDGGSEVFKSWLATLQSNPSIFVRETIPMWALIDAGRLGADTARSLGNLEKKRSNIQLAISRYIRSNDPFVCNPAVTGPSANNTNKDTDTARYNITPKCPAAATSWVFNQQQKCVCFNRDGAIVTS
ncbi:Complement component C8 alpha chain [Quaeritorhiza haematococci]|nr:Complement component C8 alpha chain [Quaeritorhiza haematococci]